MSVWCDCNGPPWPPLTRIHVGGETSRFYLCRKCHTIREDKARRDGTLVGETHYHTLDSASLPAVVVEQARDLLDVPGYQQLSLFGSGDD